MASKGLVIDDLQIKIGVEVGKTASQLGLMANSLRKTGLVARIFGKEIKDASAHTKGLFSTIGRLAKLMLIRTALRALIRSAKEGLEMFVNWDKTMNNSMAGAANAMENIKNAAANLKGQFGAFFGGLITQLEPVITWLINALTNVLDALQMISRVLQGQTTYYKYVAGSAKSAAGAAKELKNVIFGFDELNVLPSPNNGGGSASATSGRYVLTDLEGWVSKAEKEVGDAYKDKPLMRLLLFGAKGGQYLLEWVGENISKPIVEWFKNKVIPWVSQAASDVWGAITTFFTQAIPNAIRGAGEWFKRQWDAAKKDWQRDVDMVKGWFISLWNKLPEEWRSPMEKTFNTVNYHFVIPFKEVINALRKSVGALLDFITSPSSWNKEGFKKFTDDLQTIWNTAFINIQLEQRKVNSEIGKEADTALVEFKNKYGNPANLPTINIPINVVAKDVATTTANIWKKTALALSENPILMPVKPTDISYAENQTRLMQNYMKIKNMGPFAGGGVIPNTSSGTLFYAGEAGAEVVANLGHSTGVMNVSQMQDAVANGNVEVVNAIYAMANMVTGAVNNKDFDVYMDAAKVGQSVTKYQFNQARRGITQGGY